MHRIFDRSKPIRSVGKGRVDPWNSLVLKPCYHRVMRGKWFVILASVALLVLVTVAIATLSRVAPTKAKPSAPVSQPPPPVGDINLTGKIRAQHVIGVPPPVEGTIGA